MSREIRLKQAYLREENKKCAPFLIEVPRERWPARDELVKEVWRSRDFLVQIFPMKDGASRMTVSRTMIKDDGNFLEGVTWDELMRLKEECGYGRDWAVELYPPSHEVVNVANMRHLWLIREAPAFAWRNAQGRDTEARRA